MAETLEGSFIGLRSFDFAAARKGLQFHSCCFLRERGIHVLFILSHSFLLVVFYVAQPVGMCCHLLTLRMNE